MKILKTILCIATMMFGLSLTSCLDDGNNIVTRTGTDVAVITSYTDTGVYFQVATVNNGTVTLFSDQNGKIDMQKFPVGTRGYITYNITSGQDMNSTIKIDLLSIAPVQSLTIDDAKASDCKVEYKPFNVNNTYMAGNWINLICSVNKAEKRTWSCLLDTDNSNGRVAHIYLITEAEKEDYVGTQTVLSINVDPILRNTAYDYIHLHVRTTQDTNKIYEYPTK